MEMKGQEWEQWARHPQTQAFLTILGETVQEGQQLWLDRKLEDENPHSWAVKNAAALAVANYALALKEQIEQLTKETQDEE